MIKGERIEERGVVTRPDVNYRKLEALNYSMIKLFDEKPVQFFEEFKLGKSRKEKKTTALILGDLVDFYVLSCSGDEEEFDSRFDEKFALYEGNKGSGQVFTLCDYIFEATEFDSEGNATSPLEDRMKEAINRIQTEGKYRGKKFEDVLKDFEANGQDYFDTLLANRGKTVVDNSLVDKAKKVSRAILEDPFTAEIFDTDDDIEVFNHFPIEFNYILGNLLLGGDRYIPCKIEVDRLEIDHRAKTIQPYDFKTTFDNESFDYNYIKNYYYLQLAFYTHGIDMWIDKEEVFEDYMLNDFKFVVGDTSANNRRPLVYKTTVKDFSAGLNGFDFRGSHYRGISELINAIAWAEDNNIWNASKESIDAKGKMQLKIKYD